MSKLLGHIECYLGPHHLGGPDDLETAIVSFIEGARESLDVAVRELDSRPIAEAIIRARRRKVSVGLVLEAGFLVGSPGRSDAFSPGGRGEINRELYSALLRAGIRVTSNYHSRLFHQKIIIRDRESVLTGSADFTKQGGEKNLNHIIVVHDKAVALAYHREYAEILGGRFGAQSGSHGPKPLVRTVDGVRVKVLFAPVHTPEMEMMKQIAKARSRIDFAMFTLAESSGVDDQLALVKERPGMKIRGVLHRSQENQEWSSRDLLHAAGVELYLVPAAGRSGPMPRNLHHKLMVIDESLIIAGSFSYGGAANRLDDENLMLLGDLDCMDPEGIRRQRELARYVLDEIDRITGAFGERVV